jgi:hypothetical protein
VSELRRPRLAASSGQSRRNLGHSLLHAPNPPLEPLTAFPVLSGRGIKFPLIVGYRGR